MIPKNIEEGDVVLIDTWEANNVKIITWINNSVKHSIGNLKTCDISDCSGCKLAKFSSLPFNWSIYISSSPFDLIHSDVWRPSPVAIKGGSRYYVSFIDDHTRYC